MQPVFRFAPSPNGYLHLGHAYSALLNQQLARESGGRFLVRIEDIDTVRCRPGLIDACLEDLGWLGLAWEEPVLRQSSRFATYQAVLEAMERRGAVYPCFCSRKAVAAAVAARESSGGQPWPRDPDGALRYPGTCRALSAEERKRRIDAGAPFSLRLAMDRVLADPARVGAALTFDEFGQGRVAANPAVWGDVVLGRKETPTSYHLAVVLDDAFQGVTDVVRGIDLFAATAVHRLLQALLRLPTPRYRHHALLLDAGGQKLAKSRASTPIRQLRAEGVTAADIRRQLGFA